MKKLFIKPCTGRITSPFGWRIHPIKHVKSWHQGIDIAQPGPVPIRAAADGVVTRNQVLGTYGNVIMIVHKLDGQTYETNYAHLRSGSKMIVGQRVKQGDIIAYMGNTGSSTAQHLHFEIHVGRWETKQPNAVDPSELIGDVFGALPKGPPEPIQKPIVTVIATPIPQPIKKEVSKLMNTGSKSLNEQYAEFLEEAHKRGILDKKWADKARKGELTESEAIALNGIVLSRTHFNK
jgi:murein DD-endopeptidase MepM/ murein hydrolase activator NlpD